MSLLQCSTQLLMLCYAVSANPPGCICEGYHDLDCFCQEGFSCPGGCSPGSSGGCAPFCAKTWETIGIVIGALFGAFFLFALWAWLSKMRWDWNDRKRKKKQADAVLMTNNASYKAPLLVTKAAADKKSADAKAAKEEAF